MPQFGLKGMDTPLKQQRSQRSLTNLPKSSIQNRKNEPLASLLSETSTTPVASSQKYAPAKIRIFHPYEKSQSLKNHPIQKMFDNYNELIRTIFTQRNDYAARYKELLPRLLKVAKRLGL